MELQLQHQSFQCIFRTDFLRTDWFDLLAVQGTLKSLLQHHSSKASVLQHSAFFMVQLSHPKMTTGKTIALTRWTFVSKVMSLLFNILSRFVMSFPDSSVGKNSPAMWETRVQSLDWEDPLEKGKATHFSILPREFHGLYSSWGRKELDTTEQLSLHRFVITFLPRSKHLLLPGLQSPSAVILEPKKIKSVTVSIVSHLFTV